MRTASTIGACNKSILVGFTIVFEDKLPGSVHPVNRRGMSWDRAILVPLRIIYSLTSQTAYQLTVVRYNTFGLKSTNFKTC